jgi:hypothetical protein
MRDDFQIPNLGQAPKDKYEQSFFNRVVRNIETTFQSLRAKGQGIFSDLHADTLDVSGAVTLEGGIAVTGAASVTGDITTLGMVKVDPPSDDAKLTLDKPASGKASRVIGSMQGAARWVIDVGNVTAEASGSVGSNFSISRYDNTGAFVGTPVLINRATGDVTMSNNVLPVATGTLNLGSSSLRWGTIYTSDLSLNNGIGDWTIVEGEDDLFLYNNKRGKVFKFALTEVDPAIATPKMSDDAD